MIEEKPGIKRPSCMTELAGVTLLGMNLKMRPLDSGTTVSEGFSLDIAVQQAAVQDLQGPIEHRNVLRFDMHKVKPSCILSCSTRDFTL
jgi:hypothetical protein